MASNSINNYQVATCGKGMANAPDPSISDEDIQFVAMECDLDRAAFHKLYLKLSLTNAQIENATYKKSATGLHDVQLHAVDVLEYWRRVNGRKATREALLDAVSECGCSGAQKRLEKKWGLRAKVFAAASADSARDVKMIREQLMDEYCETRGTLPLLPSMPEEFTNMEDLFVDMEMIKEDSGVISKELKTYDDLVCIERKTRDRSDKDFVKRILVKGKPGVGKSTTISKLAYDWGCNKHDSPMTRFELVFVITINEINADTDLIGVIEDQLLPKVSKQGLEDYLQSHASSVAILFDGYDEATVHFDRCKDITNVLRSKWLAGAFVVVTTRPNQVGKFCQQYGSYQQIQIKGFTREGKKKYVKKFLQLRADRDADNVDEDDYGNNNDTADDDDSTQFGHDDDTSKFFERIKRSRSLLELAAIPIILSMLCLLWTTNSKLPISVTALYKDVLMHLAKHKYAKTSRDDLDEAVIFEWVEGVLFHVGKTALIGLFEDKLVFTDSEFDEQYLGEACAIGIVTKERKRSRANITRRVMFLHKTFQEMCGAMYLTTLVNTDTETFNFFIGRITKDNVYEMETFLRFACGLSVKAAESIMQHVVGILLVRTRKSKLTQIWSDENMFIEIPIFLSYEADRNAQTEDCRNVHSAMKPLYGCLNKTGEMAHWFSNDAEFNAMMKYFMRKESYTWLDDITETEVKLDDGERGHQTAASKLLCSMTRVAILRLSRTPVLPKVDTFLNQLLLNDFAPNSLSQLYFKGIGCDAKVMFLFLSSLPCLTKIDFSDVSFENGSSSKNVLLPGLKDVNITMTPFEIGNLSDSELQNRVSNSTRTVLLLLSSSPSLTNLKLILDVNHIATNSELFSKIKLPDLKTLHVRGSNDLLMRILSGFSQAKDESILSGGSAGRCSCLPLENIFVEGIQYEEASKLFEMVPYMTQLKRLALPCFFRHTFCRVVSSSTPDPRVLEKVIHMLADALQKMKRCTFVSPLRSLTKEESRYDTQLEELDLSGNHLGHAIHSLVRAYMCMPNLKHLNLDYTRMDPDNCEVLFDALIEAGVKSGEVGLPLEGLSLAENRIDDSVQKLADAYMHMKHLKSIRVSMTAFTSDQFEFAALFGALISAGKACNQGISLEVFDLAYCTIGDSVVKLAEAIMYMPSLKNLDMKASPWKPNGMNPSQCAILFDGFIAAGRMLDQQTASSKKALTRLPRPRGLKMERLVLEGNEIGESVDKLCEALKYMPCLENLCLRSCGIKEEGAQMVEIVLKQTIPDYENERIYLSIN